MAYFSSDRVNRITFYLGILLVVALAFTLRARASGMLPIDYDEDDYLLAGQHYAQAFLNGDWQEVRDYAYNYEHPPFVKLLNGFVLARLPQVPEIPERPTSDPPAETLPEQQFFALRLTSAMLGTLSVLVLALVDPLAGLFLAIHTFTIKYTSQIMLEALPALTSLLVVVCYSRAKKSSRFYLWIAASAIFLGLTAASKYLYAIVGIAILVDWLIRPAEEQPNQKTNKGFWGRILPILVWGMLSLVVFFLADPYLWTDPLTRLKASILFNTAYAQSAHVQSAGYPVWQPLVWLFQSVPWHPGVFIISLDIFIAIFALLGIAPLWRKRRVFAIWLLVGLVFLLLWSTKWPQYILLLTAPLSLAAAEGVRATVWHPLKNWYDQVRAKKGSPSIEKPSLRVTWRETRRAIPWLLPGLLVLGTIALFPLIFQAAMALTDFRATAIRDGLNGGIWREVWLGLTGQVKPVAVEAFSTSLARVKEVHYAGVSLISQLINQSADILVFEIIWTITSVGLQLVVGVAIALILNQRGLLLKRFWMVILILPWAIPEFVGVLLWQRLFDRDFGWLVLATSFPDTPGYQASSPLSLMQNQPLFVLLILLMAATWYGYPLMMVAASAALKVIPNEVYDASALDGAGRWKRFRWIIWPMILPLLTPAIILRAIFAFNQFYLFYVANAPFPMITFATLSFFVFNTSGPFGGFFALSAAINLLTVIVLALFLWFFNRWSRATEGVTYA